MPELQAASVSSTFEPTPPLTVLYDGACPLCRHEIGLYRGLTPHAQVRPRLQRWASHWDTP